MWSFLHVLVAKGTTMFGLPRWTSGDGDSSPTSFRHRYGADNESAPGRITREGEAAQGLTCASVPMMPRHEQTPLHALRSAVSETRFATYLAHGAGDEALAWLDRFHFEAMLATAAGYVRASASEVESADSAYRAGRGSQAEAKRSHL